LKPVTHIFAPDFIMKTLGLLGGMSWESTVTYYQEINRRVREVKGGLHSAPCIIFSFDFAEIEKLQHAGKWNEAGLLLDDAAAKLKLAGADAIVLCTNTMHFVSQGIEKASQLSLLHIADPTAERIMEAGYKTVGLLGTRFTMEKDFYKSRLSEKFVLKVTVPEEEDRTAIHDIIYNELCHGIITETSRQTYQKVIGKLAKAGAECLILGCTEIGLLIDDVSSELPVFDTTKIHSIAAADWAMAE
jgi:aspartate racemase